MQIANIIYCKIVSCKTEFCEWVVNLCDSSLLHKWFLIYKPNKAHVVNCACDEFDVKREFTEMFSKYNSFDSYNENLRRLLDR